MDHHRKPRLRAVLDTRVAVRGALPGLDAGSLVLVALSGGADSLALAAATSYEAGKAGLRAGAVTVDHGLQEGSAEVAERAAEQARSLGLDPVLVKGAERRVLAGSEGSEQREPAFRAQSMAGGPEAAAREARYRALAEAAAEVGARAVLTAHTRDDQAEQVLLGLARGSGLRSLAGIPPERESGGMLLMRPFLDERAGVTRSTTERACEELGLEPWRDPHNLDPAYARVRVRERVLPVLERELGPGVAAALARTADLAREDAAALDSFAAAVAAQADEVGRGRVRIPIGALSEAPAAIRNRAIRRIASQRFGAYLTREHVLAVAALVTDWRGQGPIHVPLLAVGREDDDLVFERRAGPE